MLNGVVVLSFTVFFFAFLNVNNVRRSGVGGMNASFDILSHLFLLLLGKGKSCLIAI